MHEMYQFVSSTNLTTTWHMLVHFWNATTIWHKYSSITIWMYYIKRVNWLEDKRMESNQTSTDWAKGKKSSWGFCFPHHWFLKDQKQQQNLNQLNFGRHISKRFMSINLDTTVNQPTNQIFTA